MSQSVQRKIVYLIGRLQIGGAEWQMVETAIRLNRDFFEPKLYCLFGGGPLKGYAEQYNLEVTVFDACQNDSSATTCIPLWRSKAFYSLYMYLRREQPDIVHSYLYKPSIYGGLAAKLAGVPRLVTSRRCLGYFKDGKPHYQYLENFINCFTDSVLVNSRALKDDVLQREHIPADKVQVIYNGVDTEKYAPLEKNQKIFADIWQKKGALGIPGTAPVIGMVANFFEYKGYRDFISAALRVHQCNPDAYFLCIGEDRGRIQRELEQLGKDLGIRERLIFTGMLNNISEILHLIDIQVLASHEEGFSNVILEGMASGKPVVATSVGGTPEAVIHNVTGLLVPPKNPIALSQAVISLLDNPGFATMLGCNGRKRATEHFSMEQTVSKLETFYLNLNRKGKPKCERRKEF